MEYCSRCEGEIRRACPECETATEEGAGRAHHREQRDRCYTDGGRPQYGSQQRSSRASRTGYSRAPTRDDTDVIGARIGAQVVDTIVGVVLAAVVAFVFGFVGAFASSESVAGVGLLLGAAVFVFYFFLLEGFWDGQTLGKKLFGIKVVKTDGGECTVGASIARNLLRLIDGLFYYVVGFVFMAATDKRQRLGDMFAGTVVVRAN